MCEDLTDLSNSVVFGWVGSLPALSPRKPSSPAVLTPAPALTMRQSLSGPERCQDKNMAGQLLSGVPSEHRTPFVQDLEM